MKEPKIDLDSISIASPCQADWNEMEGNDQVRFCGLCSKNVYDLSSMSSLDAERLILQKEGKLCVRFYRRQDGKILTDDCPIGLRVLRSGCRKIAAAFIGIFSALVGFGAAQAEDNEKRDTSIKGKPALQPACKKDPAPLMGAPAVRPTMGMVAAPRDEDQPRILGEMVAPMEKPSVGPWVEKYKKVVDAELRAKFGQEKANSLSHLCIRLTLNKAGMPMSWLAEKCSISASDQKLLDSIYQMKFSPLPKEAKDERAVLILNFGDKKK